ncbi:MAG TPA: hypothetical protein VFS43_43100 [Polyangiaceae bacterium]|nr:hypothetical protein [Polyangiaceae bacterium]
MTRLHSRKHRWGAVMILVGSGAVLGGCGDDDEPDGGTGGRTGSANAGSGGSGQAGSGGGQAGAGGSGTAGGGTAGSDQGGSAGQGGNAGQGGTGGGSAGEAGSGNGGSGGSDQGGSGGSGGGGQGGSGGGGQGGTGGKGGSGGAGGQGGGPPKGLTALAAGSNHACALDDGLVLCWGDNLSGQLGDGTTVSRRTPAPVLAAPGVPLAGVQSLALGGLHSCAIMNDGQVRCWGSNESGELGSGPSASYSPYPVPALASPGVPLAGVQALALGTGHTCAIVGDGRVRCWGSNDGGQLGHGVDPEVSESSPYPVEVLSAPGVPLAGVRAIAAGDAHSCAVLDDGGVRCWGANFYNQLGNGTFTPYETIPTTVLSDVDLPLAGVVDLAAGFSHGCARLANGQAHCWGYGEEALGNESPFGYYALPVLDEGGAPLAGVAALSVGTFNSCARLESGAARCWGLNERGELGDGSSRRRGRAAAVERSPGVPLAGVQALAMGAAHACALTGAGELLCWGDDTAKQIGDASPEPPGYAVAAESAPGAPLVGLRSVAFGSDHVCARTEQGEVLCWGRNHEGQLGDGTTDDRARPAFVETSPGVRLGGIVALALGPAHSCAVRGDGRAVCWGRNAEQQLGAGSLKDFEPRPVLVSASPGVALTGVQSLALGDGHTCAVVAGGQARCWGEGYDGQLGNGEPSTVAPYPVVVLASPGVPLTGVRSLALGNDHTCAALTNGEARCWGSHVFGQLGDGSEPDFDNESALPLVVVTETGEPLAGVEGVSLGQDHSCATLNDGRAYCWGANWVSQLGTGSFFEEAFAQPVLSSFSGGPLTGVEVVGAGAEHTCALVSGGAARCWGNNLQGQFGASSDNPIVDFPAPILASPGVPLAGLTSIGAGRYHAGALSDAGMALGWGASRYGQLGNGTSQHRPYPVPVALP